MTYGVITPGGAQILGKEASSWPLLRLIVVPVATSVPPTVYNSTLLNSEGPLLGTNRHVSFIPIEPQGPEEAPRFGAIIPAVLAKFWMPTTDLPPFQPMHICLSKSKTSMIPVDSYKMIWWVFSIKLVQLNKGTL